MNGTIYSFGTDGKKCAFISPPSGLNNENKPIIVWIGGLGDGLFNIAYTKQLANAGEYVFVLPILSSAYNNWGMSSLERDANEINACLLEMKQMHFKMDKIYLMGHSTGCQDIIKFMQLFHNHTIWNNIQGIILQGPVSDRHYIQNSIPPHSLAALIEEASLKQASTTQTSQVLLMKDLFLGVPITPQRFLSLVSFAGDDDMFSYDLPCEFRKNLYRNITHNNIPILVILSENDEYVKEPCLQIQQSFLELNLNNMEVMIAEGADHSLNNLCNNSIVEIVSNFINKNK